MKWTMIIIETLAILAQPLQTSAQSSVTWSAIGTGFEISSSATLITKSVLGQHGVGTMQGASMFIESGFLADSLLRTLTFVVGREEIVRQFALNQNYPNPFNPTTTISYEIPKATQVRLTVFDILGREVQTLVNETKQPGRYEEIMNGNRLASGVYVYRLQAASFIETRRALLIR
jgi:hypothetical protein